MSMASRHRLLQTCFWNPLGFYLTKKWAGLSRRVDTVLLNRSLHTFSNGETWLPTLLPKEPVVLDVGYFEGDYVGMILGHRPKATVVCFDPSKSAKRHFDAAPSNPNVTFVHAALDKTDGEAQFFDYHNMCGSLSARSDAGALQEKYTVPVFSLDNWVEKSGRRHIDLLKIDAEGYDANVIEGAPRLLQSQAIDLIMFEYADGWIANRRYLLDVVQFLADKPYKMFRMFNGFLVEFTYSTLEERFDLGMMMVVVSDKRLAKGDIPIRKL